MFNQRPYTGAVYFKVDRMAPIDSIQPLVKIPKDCTECINDKHPENCRKRCTVLLKNKGFRVKPSTDSN